MTRSLAALAVWVWAMVPSASMAREALFDAPALSDDELAEARGGFMLESGARIDFGAVITTSVDGMRVLQTQWRLTTDGASASVAVARDTRVTVEGPATAKTTVVSDPAEPSGSIHIPSPSFGGESPSPDGGSSVSIVFATGSSQTVPEMPDSASVASGDEALRARVELPDIAIYHEVGRTISSVVINTGNNRMIDNQIAINLRLDNVQPLSLGSIGFQVQALSLDAALLRAP